VVNPPKNDQVKGPNSMSPQVPGPETHKWGFGARNKVASLQRPLKDADAIYRLLVRHRAGLCVSELYERGPYYWWGKTRMDAALNTLLAKGLVSVRREPKRLNGVEVDIYFVVDKGDRPWTYWLSPNPFLPTVDEAIANQFGEEPLAEPLVEPRRPEYWPPSPSARAWKKGHRARRAKPRGRRIDRVTGQV
jgi:hypothetical protein